MTLDGDLQRRFDSARSAIDLAPGSAKHIAERAQRRTSNRRAAIGAASLLVVVALGALTARFIGDEPTESLVVVDQPAPPVDGATLPSEADFDYLGAFTLPAGDWGDSRFAYGGNAATFWADGDPASADGYPGSLFVSGHPTFNPGVAEISIPAPTLHNGATTDLPIAEVLQPFSDITDGRAMTFVASAEAGGNDQPDGFRYSGLEVVDVRGEPRLAWTVWQWQNLTDQVPGHGHSSLDITNPDPQGPWFVGDYNSTDTAGYVFSVPEDFADASLGGRRLLSGLQDNSAGNDSSFGPPFFAYDTPETAEPGSRVDAAALVFYETMDQALDDFTVVDTAAGAEWITTSDGATAIITVGSKGLGEVTNGPPGDDDCGTYSGGHAGPYEPQVLFYDPADLALANSGELEPFEVEPYRRWNPAEHLIATCEWQLASVSFDDASGLLYIVQVGVDTSQNEFSPIPVVHVFRL